MAWLNINQRFNALSDHISSLTNSVLSNEDSIDLQSLDEKEQFHHRIRELETQRSLLEREVERLNGKQRDYKNRWLASERKVKELTGSTSSEVCQDEVDLEDEDHDLSHSPPSPSSTSNEGKCSLSVDERGSVDPTLSPVDDDDDEGGDTRRNEKRSGSRFALVSAAKEINRLEEELCKVNADREHWRTLAKQKTCANSQNEEELESKRTQIKELESLVSQLKDSNVHCKETLDAKLKEWEVERTSLEEGLVELDSQHQAEISKIIDVKNELVKSLASLTSEHTSLKADFQKIADEKSELLSKLESLQKECELKEQESDVIGTSSYDLQLVAGREEPEGAPFSKQASSVGKTDEGGKGDTYGGFSMAELITVLEEKDSRINFLEKRLEECEMEKQELAVKRATWDKEQKALNGEIEILRDELSKEQRAVREANKKCEYLEENYKRELDLREQNEIDAKVAKESLEELSRLVCDKERESQELNSKLAFLEINSEEGSTPSGSSNTPVNNDVVSLAQSNEKLSTELERLRKHLIEIEEGYTKEILCAEEREKGLRDELDAAKELIGSLQVQLERNDELGRLKETLKRTTAERDKALNEASILDDKLQQATASLSNLQLVIEQLQKENERKLRLLEHQHKLAIEAELSKLTDLEWKLKWYEEKQVENAKALEAASRLAEQIDIKEEVIKSLREQVVNREELARKLKLEVDELKNSYEGKVDKQIIKSLVLGYFNTPSDKKHEVERLLARILDFSHDDMRRAGLQIGKERRRYTSGTPLNTSLSQAFVEFLENESKPASALPVQELAKDFAKAITGQKPASRMTPFGVMKHVRTPSTTSTESLLLSEPSMSSPIQPVIVLNNKKDSD